MQSSTPIDTATIAFRRVLADATAGEQARVDALVVLAQRKLFAATWPGPSQMVRTLTNSDGETALPLFTGLDSLEATATRFGWREPDGSLQWKELSAREALKHVLSRGVNFVVLDIGSEHSVEFAKGELEPLLQMPTGRAGSGPFASAGEPQAAILQAVKRSSRPPHGAPEAAAGGGDTPARVLPKRPASQPLTGKAKPPSVRPPPVLSANDNSPRTRTPMPTPTPAPPNREAPTAGHGREAAAARVAPPTRDDLKKHLKALAPPNLVLSDALRHGISAALRAFPEVEWACVVADDSPIPVIGVRVDPSFLNRVAEITDAILGAAEKQAGGELQVLLLNNPELVKSAHKNGHAFYPWRK
ncbi:MAG TPA: SseB family protein [Polyangiales bacterium]|nr:SseB family protein [Polyangiales bacterium]